MSLDGSLAVLDDPARAALTGPHRGFARRAGNAARYPVDVAPFVTLPAAADEADLLDLAGLVGPDGVAFLGSRRPVPDEWRVGDPVAGLQMLAPAGFGMLDPEAERLGVDDVADMLELTAATRPGPFAERTILLGRYYGIRDGGQLVAMAGERFTGAGWTEISAVCTAESHRGQGLAARLMQHVGAGIRARGGRAYLHVVAENAPAISVYRRLGFVARDADIVLQRLAVPAGVAALG